MNAVAGSSPLSLVQLILSRTEVSLDHGIVLMGERGLGKGAVTPGAALLRDPVPPPLRGWLHPQAVKQPAQKSQVAFHAWEYLRIFTLSCKKWEKKNQEENKQLRKVTVRTPSQLLLVDRLG